MHNFFNKIKGRTWCRWEYKIKMDFKAMGYLGVG